MKKNYLEEYNQALEELDSCPIMDYEKRTLLLDKMQELADDAVNEAVINKKISEALDEYDKIEKLKIKAGGVLFISSVVGMLGAQIAGQHGINPLLMQEISLFAEKLAVFSGSVTLAFATVGFACKMTAGFIKKDLEELKMQIGKIAFLPHNNLRAKVENEMNRE